MSPLDSMFSQYQSRAAPSAPGGPNSFFSAAVPPPSSPVGAGASSTGASPFGMPVPNLSPEQLAQVSKLLSGLVYSLPLGGYITAEEANNSNSAYVKGYYGHPMTGGDPNANLQAKQAYAIVGAAPTRPMGTRALSSLPGYSPSSGPSYNQYLQQFGIGGNYGGPFAFPGWNLGQNLLGG